MISQFSLDRQNNSNINSSSLKNKGLKNKPNFEGREKAGGVVLGLVQKCEKEPMINVAVIDLLTAILPRSIWESLTNIFAGFEALRRESSGLIVNCLIPGFITLGIAKLANNGIMGKGKSILASCWASSDSINKVTNHYKDAENTEAFKEGMNLFNGNKTHARVYAVNYNLLNEASGIDGFDKKSFNQAMSKQEMSDAAEKLTRISFKYKDGKLSDELITKTPKKKIKSIFRSISRKTHIAQDVKFGEGLEAGLERTLTDTHQLVKGMVKEGIKPENVADFVKRSKRLLKTKSILGMAVILPLAASMQHINRKITEKLSGVKGAPIHKSYGKGEQKTPEQIKDEKRQLLGKKIWAVSSMLGVAMLSMMKLPNLKTLKNIVQFKDQFPTMDQARAISAITFASRMAVADDKAELDEAHTRDIVTFSSMYFLGDYGAKAMASHLEKKTGVELLNKTFDPKKNNGFFTKAKNWILHTHLKSSDELRGVGKAFEEATKLRAKCQMANLGTSLALLGVIVPIYTRLRTMKHDKLEEAKLQAMKSGTPIQTASAGEAKNPSGINSRGLNPQFPSMKQFKMKAEVK